MTKEAVETPVLIVGGGPVGLACALLLARFNVRSLLVERHPGTSQHPKAMAVMLRTAELTTTAFAPAMFAALCPSWMRTPSDARRAVIGEGFTSDPDTG